MTMGDNVEPNEAEKKLAHIAVDAIEKIKTTQDHVITLEEIEYIVATALASHRRPADTTIAALRSALEKLLECSSTKSGEGFCNCADIARAALSAETKPESGKDV